MAKAIIVLEDADDGISVDISFKFEPNGPNETSRAHVMASGAIQLFRACHQPEAEEGAK
jgi:hypothetical protein